MLQTVAFPVKSSVDQADFSYGFQTTTKLRMVLSVALVDAMIKDADIVAVSRNIPSSPQVLPFVDEPCGAVRSSDAGGLYEVDFFLATARVDDLSAACIRPIAPTYHLAPLTARSSEQSISSS